MSFSLAHQFGKIDGVTREIDEKLPADRPRPSVLIVDDDPSICHLLKAMVESHGYTSRMCHDGAEGLEQIASHHFDVILLDLRMPSVDGAAVINRMAEAQPHALSRVIVVTAAVGDRRLMSQVANRNIYALVAKPFDLERLFETVAHCAAQMEGLPETLEYLHLMDDEAFHRFEFDLVSRYRQFDEEQEAIAIAVTRRNFSDPDALTRSRVEEILAMLEHVHDPYIR